MERRRQVYGAYSPVFWRPAVGVTEAHANFLATKVTAGVTVGLRTDHGFIIAELRGQEGFVDDFAVEADVNWVNEGASLLQEAWLDLQPKGAEAMRVVTAAAHEPKVSMLTGCSLRLASQWWVKPLVPDAYDHPIGRVQGAGFSGILGPAPPVYDPGGSVMLVDDVGVATQLESIEREAAGMGAVLAFVPAAPETELELSLQERGWTVSSQWYIGGPGGPSAESFSD